ncbi:uncharacterized protein LOC128875311 isoform X2 [Hylaeus volcanicus]|uniref:uncharacterized protein LOC128875311 isoform X2 n=1 Tax=Hylaeus volcanicus TaxID=313075 RepID=UPI0023B7AF12|nr:uncharacterized protein LOC128875311 isoform X2 [Hylaeus volcanicus]
MFVAENKKERIGKNTQFWITVLAQQLPNRTEPIQNNATQFSSSSWSPLSAFDSLKSITYFLLSFVRWQYKYRVKYAKVTIIIQEASKRGLGLNLNRNYTFLGGGYTYSVTGSDEIASNTLRRVGPVCAV